MDPQIHLIDETWIEADPGLVAAAVADPANWAEWWPDLILSVTRDRGAKGMQWAADERRPGGLRGTVEIWIEPFKAGAILHHFIRLNPADGGRWRPGRARRMNRTIAWRGKSAFWALKDRLEGTGSDRPTGTPAGASGPPGRHR